ncbi:hypothetical protein DM01DRAFT_1345510 [Hesseltinella vesiculosa]|uniref:Uncharacterized protein n=1 Tax=Hesseltinella vesiculosa TaxID=101127 RepID=A0A1X2GJP5_9FUNG|nr:hypothetical protein DM01DRAFT_1345510 [Hesseltinella vesiculosa]
MEINAQQLWKFLFETINLTRVAQDSSDLASIVKHHPYWFKFIDQHAAHPTEGDTPLDQVMHLWRLYGYCERCGRFGSPSDGGISQSSVTPPATLSLPTNSAPLSIATSATEPSPASALGSPVFPSTTSSLGPQPSPSTSSTDPSTTTKTLSAITASESRARPISVTSCAASTPSLTPEPRHSSSAGVFSISNLLQEPASHDNSSPQPSPPTPQQAIRPYDTSLDEPKEVRICLFPNGSLEELCRSHRREAKQQLAETYGNKAPPILTYPRYLSRYGILKYFDHDPSSQGIHPVPFVRQTTSRRTYTRHVYWTGPIIYYLQNECSCDYFTFLKTRQCRRVTPRHSYLLRPRNS